MSDIVELLQDNENVITRLVELIKKTRDGLDISIDLDSLAFLMENNLFSENCINLLNNGGTIRCLVDSSVQNSMYSRNLLKIVSELKHIDKIDGITVISESQYLKVICHKTTPDIFDALHSTNSHILLIAQSSFDTLFYNATPVREHLSQNDYRDELNPLPTTLRFKINDDISEQMRLFIDHSDHLCIYSSIGGMLFGYQNYYDNFSVIHEKQRNGGHKGIRWITNIRNKNDLKLVKSLKDRGIWIRHVNDNPPFDFALSNKYFGSIIERTADGKMIVDNLMMNDDRANLLFYSMIFEKIWAAGIDSDERIREIENETQDKIDIVHQPSQALHRIYELCTLARSEILIIMPSSNGFYRTEMADGFKNLNKIGAKGVKIRILTVTNLDVVHEMNKIKAKYPNILFRDLDPSIPSFSRINIFDKKDTVIWEVKDDNQQKFTDALGTALFIESIKTSETCAAIFDSLWNQSEVYTRLKKSHEKLRTEDRMQIKFMDLVAHELRTPLQSILGLTELLNNEIQNKNQNFVLGIIITNARKLQRLSENILDVTRLEGNTMFLNKESFNLNELVKSIVIDIDKVMEYNKSIIFEYKDFEKDYMVFADKFRIGQVILNLIDNSIRFIAKKGTIIISLSETVIHSKEIVVLSITDDGESLNPEILSKLFNKFASDSYYGAGLGLYLCKRILEAHGGRIWAKNNKDREGCTFSFGIPKDSRNSTKRMN